MSDEGLRPVAKSYPEQMAVYELNEAYYKLRKAFSDIHVVFKPGSYGYNISFDFGSLEDVCRFVTLLSNEATHAVQQLIVPDDRCANVPLEYYLKRIPEATSGGPEPKWRFVSASPVPKKIIYSGPATIVLWADGTKTVVKCSKHDSWNAETGFLWALAEKLYGSKSQVDKVMGRWLRDAGQER